MAFTNPARSVQFLSPVYRRQRQFDAYASNYRIGCRRFLGEPMTCAASIWSVEFASFSCPPGYETLMHMHQTVALDAWGLFGEAMMYADSIRNVNLSSFSRFGVTKL